jgi:hypothetical protein
VRKEGGVEIQPVAVSFGPVRPAGEVLRLHCVTLDLAVGLQVDGMQRQPVLARDQAVRQIEIAAELIGGAGFAGVVAGRGDAARQLSARRFKPADIVALPAVQADRDPGQSCERRIRVYAELRIPLAGDAVGVVDLLFGGVVCHAISPYLEGRADHAAR